MFTDGYRNCTFVIKLCMVSLTKDTVRFVSYLYKAPTTYEYGCFCGLPFEGNNFLVLRLVIALNVSPFINRME